MPIINPNNDIIRDEDAAARQWAAAHPAELAAELRQVTQANQANDAVFADRQKWHTPEVDAQHPAAQPKVLDLTPQQAPIQNQSQLWDPIATGPPGGTQFGPTPPADINSDHFGVPTAGRGKLNAQLFNAPTFAGTPQSAKWDHWLLSLPFDKTDYAYNDALSVERMHAIEREKGRGNANVTGLRATGPTDPDTLARLRAAQDANNRDALDMRALKLATEQGFVQQDLNKSVDGLPQLVNAFDQPVTVAQALKSTSSFKPPTGDFGLSGALSGSTAAAIASSLDTGGTTDPSSSESDTLDTTATGSGVTGLPGNVAGATGPLGKTVTSSGPVTSKQIEASGKMVWLGKVLVTREFNGHTYTAVQDKYTTVNDAYYTVTDPGFDIVGFQRQQRLKVTGVADKATRTAWGNVVATANFYTTTGQHMDLVTAARVTARSASGGGGGGGGGSRRRRGGGGGGGGGGGTLVPADQAKYLLNQTMQKYAGRDANDAEFQSFLSAVKGAAASPDFDGTQFAIDWVKGRMPQDVGSFQAATNYYAALQQLIGGA